MIDSSTSSPVCPLVSTDHHTLVTSVVSAHHDHTVYTYICIDGRARPKKRGTDGLQAYQAFVLLHCVIAMNIVVPLTTAELSLLQRRGGARKPINTMIGAIGAGMYYVGQSCNMIGAA